MQRLFALIIWPLLWGTAAAQIEIESAYEAHQPIVAKIGDARIPDGAKVDGGWRCDTAEIRPGQDASTVHIWAAPGEHRITYQGAWVQTVDKTIDGETLPILIGFGFLNEQATFRVGPPPDPPPPPPPPGPRVGVIVEETTRRTADQAALWIRLRQKADRDQLKIVDQDLATDETRPYVQAARESGLPLPVLVVGSESGEILRVVPVPPTVDLILRELAK